MPGKVVEFTALQNRRKLTVSEIQNDPHAEWNAFVDLVGREDCFNLSEIQRQAHLAFWYDGEVQNGGHFQYFENRGLEVVPETIDALRAIGATKQAMILKNALGAASGRHWGDIETAEEFIEEALESGLDEFDTAYYDSHPTVLDLLRLHLKKHRDQYIQILDDPA